MRSNRDYLRDDFYTFGILFAVACVFVILAAFLPH